MKKYLDKPWNVCTGSGRRPTPKKYEHLRKFVEQVKKFINITNVTELTEVQNILNQTATLQISNEIGRVISQLIGLTAQGFVTIKSTADGALHVYPVGGVTPGVMDVKIADGEDEAQGGVNDAIAATGGTGTLSAKLRSISQTLGTKKTFLTAKIDIATIATHDIIAAAGGLSHHICAIVFTVDGEVNIELEDATGVLSGPMDFGGTDEPRGMSIAHETIPLKCHVGEAFSITLDAAEQVSGYITYYDE